MGRRIGLSRCAVCNAPSSERCGCKPAIVMPDVLSHTLRGHQVYKDKVGSWFCRTCLIHV